MYGILLNNDEDEIKNRCKQMKIRLKKIGNTHARANFAIA
jgi:hypothetical protein